MQLCDLALIVKNVDKLKAEWTIRTKNKNKNITITLLFNFKFRLVLINISDSASLLNPFHISYTPTHLDVHWQDLAQLKFYCQ